MWLPGLVLHVAYTGEIPALTGGQISQKGDAVPLPEGYEALSMEESVELSLAGLDKFLEPGDMALVTAIRKAARAIDKLEAEDKISQALSFHYMVTGGLEKLGGSVASRTKLGLKQDKDRESPLAAVRGIRDRGKSSEGSAEGKPAGSARRKPSARKAG